MAETILILSIAIALSMDAFSLSLGLGSMNISSKNIIKLALCVGIMHLFMPLLGVLLGEKIVHFFSLNSNLLLGVILIFLSVQMIIETKKECEKKSIDFSILGMFLFAFGVSVDAFSTGLGLKAITDNIIYASFLFSIVSFCFTYLGLLLGKYANNLLGTYATYLGAILLILIGIVHICRL